MQNLKPRSEQIGYAIGKLAARMGAKSVQDPELVFEQSLVGLPDYEANRRRQARHAYAVFREFAWRFTFAGLAWLALCAFALAYVILWMLPGLLDFFGIILTLESGLSNLVYDLAYTGRGTYWMIQLKRLMFIAGGFWLYSWIEIFTAAKNQGIKDLDSVS